MILKGGLDNKISKIAAGEVTHIAKGYVTFSIIGGEFAVTSDETGIAFQTLLGSCVAVMLYDRGSSIKAINHFLLPVSKTQAESYRFGLFSLENMLNQMYKMGCKKDRLVAKIAGGAKLLDGDITDIGQKNVDFARDFCDSEKIPVISEHVFGQNGRVVLMGQEFETFIRLVDNSAINKKIKEEDENLKKLINAGRGSSSVTLF